MFFLLANKTSQDFSYYMVPSGPLLKTEKDKNNNKKLEPKYRCSPSLVYFFISAVVKLKKKKNPLVVQLYHTARAGQRLND